jgi:hypothetical protein
MENAMLPKTDPTFRRKSEDRFGWFMKNKLALKDHAPRLRVLTFKRDRLSFLLGPGGQVVE